MRSRRGLLRRLGSARILGRAATLGHPREPRSRTRVLSLGVLLIALPCGGAEMPPIGIIDFYGLRGGVSEAQARQALPFREGDPVPESVEAAVTRLEAVPGVLKAAIERVCCEQGRGIVYVGIEERGAPLLRFRPPPPGGDRLPASIRELGQALDQARFDAVRRGQMGEEQALGHALSEDPAVRALQEKLPTLAAQHLTLLRRVLQGGAEAEDRALAGHILGYAPNKAEVVDDLAFGMQDPDPGVRNDCMRALWVIAAFARTSPQLGIRVPPQPFVALLDSLAWTDRNKAVAALLELSEDRHPSLLRSLRERALLSLVEMARFKSAGHAYAPFALLGRVAGLSEEEVQAAWSGPERAAAIEEMRKRAAGLEPKS